MNVRLIAAFGLVLSALMMPLRADDKNDENNKKRSGGTLRVFIDQPATNSTAALRGTFDIRRFAASEDGKTLNAIGTLSISDGTRTIVTTTAIPVISATPVAQNTSMSTAALTSAAVASCPILHLVLGPLHLNLLGLNVDLNQLVLDITAIPGPGNLLGNLLCSIAGLLNPGGGLPGALQALIAALNNLLAAL